MPGSTSRIKLRSAIEATFGSVTGATERRTVRMTGDTLDYQIQYDSSKEIRSDRMVSDHIPLACSANGGFNFEWLYKEYDTYLEDMLQSTFTRFNTTGVSPTLTSPTFAANSLTQTGGTSFATIGLGQWVYIAGCTGAHAANNGVWESSRSVAATATVLTFEGNPFTATGVAAGTVTISTSRLANGTSMRSRSLEVEFNDLTLFLTFLGMTGSKMSGTFQPGSIATGGFDFMGSDVIKPLSGASNLPGTDAVAFPTTYDPVNCTSHIFKLYEAGAALPAGVKARGFDFSLDNKLRAQPGLQTFGPTGFGNGTIELGGKMSVYFANAALYDKYTQSQASSVAVVLKDPANNGYALTFPAIEFTEAKISRGSLDQDCVVDLTWRAKKDTVHNKMIVVDQFGAAV